MMFEKKSKCQICGKEIVNHNGLKKYCNKCRQKKDHEVYKKVLKSNKK